MKYNVFTDGKSWVMITSSTSKNSVYAVSTVSEDSDDKFSVKKGVKCAIARGVNGIFHPMTDTISKLVFDSIDNGQYFAGQFVVDNVYERLAKRLFKIFSKQYVWSNGHTIMWRTIDEVASFIVARKVKEEKK